MGRELKGLGLGGEGEWERGRVEERCGRVRAREKEGKGVGRRYVKRECRGKVGVWREERNVGLQSPTSLRPRASN